MRTSKEAAPLGSVEQIAIYPLTAEEAPWCRKPKLRMEFEFRSAILGESFGRAAKVAARMVREVVYGVQARGSVRPSEIGRALGEGIGLKKVIERLGRQLARPGLPERLAAALLGQAAASSARTRFWWSTRRTCRSPTPGRWSTLETLPAPPSRAPDGDGDGDEILMSPTAYAATDDRDQGTPTCGCVFRELDALADLPENLPFGGPKGVGLADSFRIQLDS